MSEGAVWARVCACVLGVCGNALLMKGVWTVTVYVDIQNKTPTC